MKTLFWTKTGLVNLGRVIRCSRQNKGLNLRDAAELISATGVSVAATTLGTIEKGNSEPAYNTLAAIAASGLVEIGGRSLDIFDFIAIASGTAPSAIASESDGGNMDALSQLIKDYLVENHLSLREFAQQCGVSRADLEAIMRGGETADYEGDLILIAGHLNNPATGRRFHSYLELLDYCGMQKNAAGRWEESHVANNADLS